MLTIFLENEVFCFLRCRGITYSHDKWGVAGVFVSGDFSYWYESGPVAEMVIEESFFDNCNYDHDAAAREPPVI
ncbi:MAG: hypothetical protein IJY46_01240 [Lentisphaeria bacterium]|nr:hypothetical protein [Lentisphaeria bacterium]